MKSFKSIFERMEEILDNMNIGLISREITSSPEIAETIFDLIITISKNEIALNIAEKGKIFIEENIENRNGFKSLTKKQSFVLAYELKNNADLYKKTLYDLEIKTVKEVETIEESKNFTSEIEINEELGIDLEIGMEIYATSDCEWDFEVSKTKTNFTKKIIDIKSKSDYSILVFDDGECIIDDDEWYSVV